MNLKKEFTASECEWFRRECNFTDQEMLVFNARVNGHEWSVTRVACELHMSESTVNRRIRDIKRKICRVILS